MTTFVGFPQSGHSFSADEVGRALSGLVVREASGLPRTGVFGSAPAISAVPASWKVQVAPFVYVHQAAGAIQFSGVSEDEQVDILPAVGNIPAGQARIDVLCWNPINAKLSVVRGAPAVSPVVPSTGILAALARVRVGAGEGMVLGGQISSVYQFADRVSGSLTNVAGGHSIGAATRIELDSTGMVDAYVEVSVGSGQLVSSATLAVMPEGFRPVNDVEFAGAESMGGRAAAVFVQVLASGVIRVWNPTGNKKLSFHVRYRVK